MTTPAPAVLSRASRTRRWCLITAASATIGAALGLVQLTAGWPLPVRLGLLTLTWAVDNKMRNGARVSDVRQPYPVALLIAARIPFATVLAACLGIAPLLTLLAHH